jgi:amino acid transporter
MVWKLRRTQPDRERPYRIPMGGLVSLVAAVASALLILAALYDPYASAGKRIPLEWMILAVWGALGFVLFTRQKGVVVRDQARRSDVAA